MNKAVKQVIIATTVGAAIGGGLTAEAILTAPKSHADIPISGCQDDLWWTLDATRRTICDGIVMPDGTYTRVRIRYTPRHYVPFTCSTYGSYSYASTSCSGGYTVDYNEAERTSYMVSINPEADNRHLPDEPEHLVNGLRPRA